MRRVIPGQDIVINRDEEDGEGGDLGVRRSNQAIEKSSGSNTSSDQTAAPENIEMTEQGGQHSGEHNSGEESNAEVEEDAGERTPPLAEYREGPHLVIERRVGSGNEVEVEVIRNEFSPHKESVSHKYNREERLGHEELERIRERLHKLEDGGRVALGYEPRRHSRSSSHSSDQERRPQYGMQRQESPVPLDEPESSSRQVDESNEEEEEDHTISRRLPGVGSPPKIKVNDGKKPGLRQRIFGLGKSKAETGPSEAEEGRAAPDPNLLAPRTSTTTPVPIRSVDTAEENNALSPVISRGTAVRFAPGSSMSSDTAPGMGNYGNNNPGFKRNPTLAMYRSTSVQSSGSQRETSVSFKEPTKR